MRRPLSDISNFYGDKEHVSQYSEASGVFEYASNNQNWMQSTYRPVYTHHTEDFVGYF